MLVAGLIYPPKWSRELDSNQRAVFSRTVLQTAAFVLSAITAKLVGQVGFAPTYSTVRLFVRGMIYSHLALLTQMVEVVGVAPTLVRCAGFTDRRVTYADRLNTSITLLFNFQSAHLLKKIIKNKNGIELLTFNSVKFQKYFINQKIQGIE